MMDTPLTPHEALIYAMVTTSATDRTLSDTEIRRIGELVRSLPAFQDFDEEKLVRTAETCGDLLGQENGLARVLDAIAEDLPERLHDTAYALAVEAAVADLDLAQEELRFLQMLRDRLDLDKLSVAAIEHAARARHRKV